jgi:hypothetical protein
VLEKTGCWRTRDKSKVKSQKLKISRSRKEIEKKKKERNRSRKEGKYRKDVAVKNKKHSSNESKRSNHTQILHGFSK